MLSQIQMFKNSNNTPSAPKSPSSSHKPSILGTLQGPMASTLTPNPTANPLLKMLQQAQKSVTPTEAPPLTSSEPSPIKPQISLSNLGNHLLDSTIKKPAETVTLTPPPPLQPMNTMDEQLGN